MEKTLDKNLYSRDGLLLISKGSKIVVDSNNRDKLERLGILKDIIDNKNDKNNKNNDKRKIKIVDIEKPIDINEITRSFALSNSVKEYDESFIKITDVINDILHNYKTKMWYSHLNALVNYVSWIYAHSVNTAMLSGIIGIKLGYTYERVYQLVLGAILHDVGMILIPREILLKPSRLSDTELSIVQKHCELGRAMIEGAEIDPLVKTIVLQHHERVDGSGYPSNLKDLEINEESKIVMVADSFDTATSYRPYKAANDSLFVINEMLSDNDKYDYKIVNTLKKYLF